MEAEAAIVLARWVYYGAAMTLFGSSLFPLYAGPPHAEAASPRIVATAIAFAMLVALSSRSAHAGRVTHRATRKDKVFLGDPAPGRSCGCSVFQPRSANPRARSKRCELSSSTAGSAQRGWFGCQAPGWPWSRRWRGVPG